MKSEESRLAQLNYALRFMNCLNAYGVGKF